MQSCLTTKPTKWHVRAAKTLIRLGRSSKDSDQPGHLLSLIRVFTVRSIGSNDPRFLHVDSKDSDQTGRMPRLIWVIAGHTSILLVCHEAAQILMGQLLYLADPYQLLHGDKTNFTSDFHKNLRYFSIEHPKWLFQPHLSLYDRKNNHKNQVWKRASLTVSTLASGARGQGFDPHNRREKKTSVICRNDIRTCGMCRPPVKGVTSPCVG